MQLDCEGCAGCCLDWRSLAPDDLDHERRGPYRPLDDTYNLAPLSSDEIRAFVDAGEAAALTPRLFRTEDGPSTTVAGVDLAAVGDRPAFLVGLRKVPKPVAPFDAPTDPLAEFLVERYRFYTEAPDGSIRYTDVDHDTWTLYPAAASVDTDTLLRADGFARPDTEPVYYYSPGVDVVASRSKRL